MDRPPYRVVLRLLWVAGEHWATLDGQAAMRGVNLLDLTLDRFLNVVYAWALERVKDVAAFDAELYRDVQSVDPAERARQARAAAKAELDDFAALMAATGGG